jgi:GNAT superfamily N-acetyltransferase
VTLDRPETTRHLVFVYEPHKLPRVLSERRMPKTTPSFLRGDGEVLAAARRRGIGTLLLRQVQALMRAMDKCRGRDGPSGPWCGICRRRCRRGCCRIGSSRTRAWALPLTFSRLTEATGAQPIAISAATST